MKGAYGAFFYAYEEGEIGGLLMINIVINYISGRLGGAKYKRKSFLYLISF
jgi:hypothetical protein